jgi:hypothetical protein
MAMNVEDKIRELVKSNLSDDHEIDGTRFIDQLLCVADEVGELKCSLLGKDKLRFELPERSEFNVATTRAKSKLRMLCARLAVLCKEGSGGQEVSIYGGEGVIKEVTSSNRKESREDLDRLRLGGRNLQASILEIPPGDLEPPPKWTIRFKNTASEQEFTISKLGARG